LRDTINPLRYGLLFDFLSFLTFSEEKKEKKEKKEENREQNHRIVGKKLK